MTPFYSTSKAHFCVLKISSRPPKTVGGIWDDDLIQGGGISAK